MLKKFIFCMCSIGIISILFFGATVFAAPICPVPVEFTQPNGDVITVTSYGDEFFSWQEDENGNIITYDEESNSYKYAEIKDGKIISTPHIVGGISLFSAFSHKIQREDIIPLWENAERIDYSQPTRNNGVQLFSADIENVNKKPLTNQKLLTVLIEFSDVKIKHNAAFWNKQMFDTTQGALSVVNYWKENSNGLDVFEPTRIVNAKTDREGAVAYNDLNVSYKIDDYADGVVKVSLDMSHPIKSWRNNYTEVRNTASLAVRAIEENFTLDSEWEDIHLITIFAGQGRIYAHSESFGIKIANGDDLGWFAVQEELMYEDVPVGIGPTCHELGHSVFNLPDLYFSNQPGMASNGLAIYSLMAVGSWGHRYAGMGKTEEYDDPYAGWLYHVPTHLDPWCKMQLGYVTPTVVNEWDGDINSISETGDDSDYNIIEIRSKADPNQYFLIENRQLIGFDQGLEAVNEHFRGETDFNGGILIYHVDENVTYYNNNNSTFHGFIQIERNDNSSETKASAATWAYLNTEGRSKFGGETAPNSNFHEQRVLGQSCSALSDCHPQTVESGISIEVIGDNSPHVRVKANVDEEHAIEVEDIKFSEVFKDMNFCNAIIEILEDDDGINRTPESIMSIRDWAKLWSIYSLDISNKGIKDLKGIENLSSLNYLYCENNEIESLDLSSWEYLIYLDCSNNLLTELNISGNQYLENLWCANNLLTKLDTKENGELWELICFNNKLTELNFENNPKLLTLECYDNYMDAEIPDKSLIGLEPLKAELGEPENKENATETSWFVYYPQKTVASTPTVEPSPTPTVSPSPTPIPKTGDRVELEQTGNVVTATLIFEETKPPKQDDIWIIVAYKKDGVLKSAEVPQLVDMTASFIIPKAFEDCEISAYVWDKDMKSIMGVQKIK